MSDFIIGRIASAAGKAVGGPWEGVVTAVTAASFAEAEFIDFVNGVIDGTADSTDIWEVVARSYATIVGVGAIGITRVAMGVPMPLAIGLVIVVNAWAAYERNGEAIQDAIEEAIDGVKNGRQPWDWVPDAIDAYSKASVRRRVSPFTNDRFRDATNPPRRDPLAIDLDGDGIETLGIPTDGSGPVLFDHDANGVKTGTGWLHGDDAWLVLDRDGNGSIDSGRELFGVDTVITETRLDNAGQPYTSTRRALSGFDALRSEDRGSGAGTAGAADGRFDSLDAAFAQVRLWQDLNGDGISQAGELSTLAERGIQSISLALTGGTTDLGNGNTLGERASVLRSNGSTTVAGAVGVGTNGVGNLNLADNPFYREFTDAIALSEVARGLPEMGGSGWVRDLREAANAANFGDRSGATRQSRPASVGKLNCKAA